MTGMPPTPAPEAKMDWTLINARCQDVLDQFAGAVDLVVTSPPYDDLRAFGGAMDAWDFDAIAPPLAACLAPGGTLVWIVGDAIIDGGESLTSLRQAIAFQYLGLRCHQTLIYEGAHMRQVSENRYMAGTQYMFVFSNGAPKTANIIRDRKNIITGMVPKSQPGRSGDAKPRHGYNARILSEYGKRTNIWRYNAGYQHMGRKGEHQMDIHDHPAVFPYTVAADHINTWSAPGDTVLDPMAGSGTTLRAAYDLGRRAIGIEVSSDYCRQIRRRMAQQTLC